MIHIITGARITFGLYDLTAREDATFTPFPLQSFSNIDQFANNRGTVGKFATLEEDQIITDGSFQPFPENPVGFGLWSLLQSDANGLFTSHPILRARFKDANHSSIGLSLHFDNVLNDWAGETEIRWYDENDVLIMFQRFIPDKTPYFFNRSVSDYRRVEFEFLGTSKPYRFLKLNGIDFGIVATKEGNELLAATVGERVNAFPAQIEISTLNCEFRSADTDFSMLSAKGIYAYLQERQKLEVIGIQDGEEFPAGTFYVDTWEDGTTQSVRLYCVDILGVIDKTQFDGGLYVKVKAGTIISQIMASAGVTTYTIDPLVANVELDGHIPICTHRQALQLVCMAAGGVLNSTRDGIPKIQTPPTEATRSIPISRKFVGQTPGVDPLTTGVEVHAHTYVKRTDITEIIRQEYEKGEHSIKFNQPTHSVTVLGAAVTKLTVNIVVFTLEEPGEVVVTGAIYEAIKQPVLMELPKIPVNSAPSVARLEDCTLISNRNARDVAVRMLDYYANRYKVECQILPGDEQAGEIAVIDTKNEASLRAHIESLDLNLTGGHIGKIVAYGQPVPIVYGDYTGEIYTGETIGVL